MEASLLAKYFSGKCTEEEKQAVKSWVSESQENRVLMHRIKEIWEVEPRDEFQPRVKAGLQQVRKRLQENRRNAFPSPSPGARHEPELLHGIIKQSPRKRGTCKKAYFWTAAAAAVLLISVLSVWQYSPGRSGSNETDMQKIETTRGERSSFTLSDGSKVILNAESKLEMAAEFDTGAREVYLQGEAYFDVASVPDRPFIIFSRHTYTRVVGTRFGISAYPDDPKVQTVVEEGRVLFGVQAHGNESGNSAELRANEIAEVEENGTIKQQQIARPIAQYLGWKDGQLVFDQTPLREIIPKLERWYNITLGLEDPVLGERLLTATFQEESLTEVLNIIALSLDLNYSRTAPGKIIFSDISSSG